MKIWVDGIDPPCHKCVYRDDEEACLASDCVIDYENWRCSYYIYDNMSAVKPLRHYTNMLDRKRKSPKIHTSHGKFYTVGRKDYEILKLFGNTKEEVIDKWKQFHIDHEMDKIEKGYYIKPIEEGYVVLYKDTRCECETYDEAVAFCKNLILYFYRGESNGENLQEVQSLSSD